MRSGSRLAVILAPRGGQGEALANHAAAWISEGILSDFVWVKTDDLNVEGLRKLELQCCFASDTGTGNNFDLFQYLSQVVIDQLDVVVPWVVGDSQADDELWALASALRAALKDGMPNGGSGASVRSKWLYTTLLVMPTTDRAVEGFEKTSREYGEFDLNVYVSPETRSNPWAGSAPLRQGADFDLYALAQIASVAGCWAGTTESLTGLLERKSFRFGQGSFVMLRTMSSMVVTKGLADRLVNESLEKLSTGIVSPYEVSDPNDLDRPSLIADDAQLVSEQIAKRVKYVLEVAGDELTYISEPKPEAVDFSRDWKEAVRFFWRFTKDVVKAMPRYTGDYLKNEWTRIIDRKLNDVREAVPERYLGVTLELREMLDDIQKFRNDHQSQDSLALSSAAYRKNPKIWATLREVAIGALDGSDSPQGEKPIVLPRVDYVVHDPNARFTVPTEFLEQFGLESTEVTLGQAIELKELVAAEVKSENERLDQIISEINVIKLQLSDPYLAFSNATDSPPEEDNEQFEEELQDQDVEEPEGKAIDALEGADSVSTGSETTEEVVDQPGQDVSETDSEISPVVTESSLGELQELEISDSGATVPEVKIVKAPKKKRLKDQEAVDPTITDDAVEESEPQSEAHLVDSSVENGDEVQPETQVDAEVPGKPEEKRPTLTIAPLESNMANPYAPKQPSKRRFPFIGRRGRKVNDAD